jgi:hypothetical protein
MLSNSAADGMDSRTVRTRRRLEARGSRAPGRVAPRPASDDSLGHRRDESAEVARYIADMTAQLASMARVAGLGLLAYFLSMANAESEANARGGGREPPLP